MNLRHLKVQKKRKKRTYNEKRKRRGRGDANRERDSKKRKDGEHPKENIDLSTMEQQLSTSKIKNQILKKCWVFM